MGDPMQAVPLPLPCQESPDGGRTHLEEQPPCFLIDMEMSTGRQVLPKEGHACYQTDRTKEGACTPDRDECLLDERVIPELDGAGVRVWQDQPRGDGLPGGTAVPPDAGRGRHTSGGTPWIHRSRPAWQTSLPSSPSDTSVP